MDYIIIDTFNGQGYSDSGSNMIRLLSLDAAMTEARQFAEYEADDIYEMTFNKEGLEGGFGFETYQGDCGTYQVHRCYNDSYGVIIHPLINEAVVVGRERYYAMMKESFEQCDLEESYPEDGHFEGGLLDGVILFKKL